MQGKKIKGRKRHILVDTLGFLIAATVHAASIQDRVGAKHVIRKAKMKYEELVKLWADGGYAGTLIAWAKETWGIDLEIVKRSDAGQGFIVLPKRWIVERTLAWLTRCRRLARDYERLTKTAETMIYLGMTRLMLTRIARCYV